MTIKRLGSAYKFRVGRATGNEHIFLLGLSRDKKNISQSHQIHEIASNINYMYNLYSVYNSIMQIGKFISGDQ